jgi:hypothetical protein
MKVWKRDRIKPKEGVRVSGSASPQVIKSRYAKIATGDASESIPSRKRWKLKNLHLPKDYEKEDFMRRRSLNSYNKKENERRKDIYDRHKRAMSMFKR